LDYVMYFDIWIVLLNKCRDLQFAQKRSNDKNIFDVFGVWHGLEHIEQMFKCRFTSHTDEWFGLAKSMRTHTRAPACHGNNDFEGFSQGLTPLMMSYPDILQ